MVAVNENPEEEVTMEVTGEAVKIYCAAEVR